MMTLEELERATKKSPPSVISRPSVNLLAGVRLK